MLQSIVSLKQNASSGNEYENSTEFVEKAVQYELDRKECYYFFVSIASLAAEAHERWAATSWQTLLMSMWRRALLLHADGTS